MLHKQKPANPIVKLFPRLAPVVASAGKGRVDKPRPRVGQVTISRTKPRQDKGTQVRAHLLRMILDNERSRRHDQRPNAS